MRNRLVAIAAIAALAFSACSTGATTAPTTAATTGPAATTAATQAAAGCLVGVSWNNYTQERWAKADEPNIKKAVSAGGGTYTRTDAHDNSEQQLKDVDNLMSQGAKVLIILAKDAVAIKPAIDKAKAAGIPVIGRLLHHVRQQARRHRHRDGSHEGCPEGQLRDHQGRPR